MRNQKLSRPYLWVPSLYFAEGLPYVAVMTVSLILYKQLGLSNADITFYTSWLYLPWVIKPLWSPFVDVVKTKRWWILTMEVLIGAAFGGVAFTIPTSFWLQGSLFFFWVMAFSSATHAQVLPTTSPPTVSTCLGSMPISRHSMWASAPRSTVWPPSSAKVSW